MRRTRMLVIACALALALAVPVIATSEPGPASARMAHAVPAAPPATTAPGGAGRPAPEPMAPAAPEPEPPAARTGLAAAAVAAAESEAAGSTQLAITVLDRETGETAVGGRGAEPFYTASLSKVVLTVDVLDRRRLDGLAVADSDVALIRRALGPSDDSAMSALWDRFDGAGAARRVSNRLGLSATTAPRDPSQWGEMSVPATDTVLIWQHVLDDMPAADRDLMISAMDAAPDRASDGFNQAFGLISPAVDGPGGPGAVAKQGWMCCFSGVYYLHSAGVVGADQRFVVALLTRIPRGPGWEAARDQLTGIATAAARELG